MQIRKEETLQHVILGVAVVTFGAGLAIRGILTVLESCRIRINNLPLDAEYNEICSLFTDRAIKQWQFHVVDMKTVNGQQEADVICQADVHKIITDLDGIDFMQKKLIVEVRPIGDIDGAKSSAEDTSKILTISWRARSADSTLLRRFNTKEYDIVRAPEYIRLRIEEVGRRSWLTFFESTGTDATTSISTARAHFDTWEHANHIYHALKNQRFWFIGNAALLLEVPYEFQYSVTVPAQQYCAQKAMWNSLIANGKSNKGCKMQVNAKDKGYVIRIMGKDRQAVGLLKVWAENLVAGEKLECWHHLLGVGADGQHFLDLVFNATGACVRRDQRLLRLKAYGEPRNVQKACTMLESEVARLESLEQTIYIRPESMRFFAECGLPSLQANFEKDNVALHLSSPCQNAIMGDELERYTLSRLTDELVDGSQTDPTCPVCHDKVTSPVRLACGHSYCKACILHFLTTASSTKIFPLSCISDGNDCQTPISISTLKPLLPPQTFLRLLETAFVTHVERFPQSFKYCPTPGCNQVYRCTKVSAPSAVHCRSCLSAVCSSCHGEAHTGMTCAEWIIHNNPIEQQRLNDQLANRLGFKKCPKCKILIEKVSGCNHVTCRCGAQICWACMGVFAKFYNHNCVADTNGSGTDQNGVEADARPGLQEEQPRGLDVGTLMELAREGEDEYDVQMRLLREAGLLRRQRRCIIM